MTLFLFVVLLACTSRGGDTGTDTSTTLEPTFTNVAEVFSGSCAFSSCHGGTGSPAEGLDLSAGNAYTNIVGVPSTQQPDVMLVAAGDSAASYLYRKCAGDASIDDEKMPPPSGLDAERLALFKAWIDAGAPNN